MGRTLPRLTNRKVNRRSGCCGRRHALDPRNVLRAFVVACGKAGVDGASVHTLRHAAASLMIAQGADVVAVSRVLGHSRTSTTLNIYGHTTSEAQAAALGSLGAALGL